MSFNHRMASSFLDSAPCAWSFCSKTGKNIHDPSVNYLGSLTRSFFFREQMDDDDDPRWVHRLPDSPSLWDRILFPVYSFLAWMRLLSDNFDWRFILMVFCGQHLLKGMLAGGGSNGLLVVEGLIYMRLKVGARLKTIYLAVGSGAWGLKPLYALISDTVSISGYRRGPLVVVSAIVATLAYITLSFESAMLTGTVVCLCFFCAKLQLALTDLMVEATYTEKMEAAPKYSADIVSFAWSGIGLFGMIGVLIAGPGVDYFGPDHIVALAIPFSSVIIVPTLAGYLTEKRLPQRRRWFRLNHARDHWNYFLCTIILIIGVIATLTSLILNVGPHFQAILTGVVCTVTGGSAILLLPPVVWRPLMYMFLTNSFSLAIGGFVDNFYLDPATEEESKMTGLPMCKDCPHFSATFYYTVMGVFDSLCMMLGSYIFSLYMSKWSYRRALCVSTVLCSSTCFLDIIQYQRWNLIWGLPDWVFMLGKSSVQNTLAMISFMPTTILYSKVCPRGLEASVYALLAGFSNYGNVISGYLGAYALTLVGMDHIGSGTEDDFSNAWKACIIGGLSAPISLLLLPVLIPDALMTEDLQREPAKDIFDGEEQWLLNGHTDS